MGERERMCTKDIGKQDKDMNEVENAEKRYGESKERYNRNNR